MASPAKTWISVILGIVVAYFLYYNVSQIVDVAKALDNDGAQKLMWANGVAECEMWVGMVGTGTLVVMFVIAAMVIFLNKQEPHPFHTQSQFACFIAVGALLGVSLISSAMVLVEKSPSRPFGDTNTVLIITLAMASLRLLIGGAIVGCGIHALQHDHS